MPAILDFLTHAFGPASLFGLVAFGAMFAWPFFQSTRAMLAVQTIGAGSFSTHFLLIGAETAALTSCVAVVQLFAVRFLTSSLQVHSCFAISAVVLAALALQSWHGFPSTLALFGCLLASLARLQKVPRLMKVGFLASTPFWIADNLLVGSVFGSAVDAVSLIGNLGSFWRARPA